jgi:RimJ/RimL family protein N-acetyltransferase
MGPVEPVSLTDGALLLRPPRPSDAAALVAAVNDPEIARWSSLPRPYTAEHARIRLEEAVPAGWAAGSPSWYVVAADAPDVLLAAVGLHGVAHGRTSSADVGCWTVRAARRQGRTAHALAVLCRWAFDDLGLERLQWQSFDGNTASQRLADRLGFVAEGIARSRLLDATGAHRDTWVAGLLPGELRVPAGVGARTEVLPVPDAFAGLSPAPALSPSPSHEAVPEIEITAGTLHLRPWQLTDVTDVAAVIDDPDLARWNPLDRGAPVPGADPHDRALAFVRDAGDWSDGSHASFAVLDATTAELLGSISVHQLRRDLGSAEVGFWTVPAARGRGVAVRALESVSRWAAGALGLTRLDLIHAAPNAAACAVAERAGFGYELTLRAGYRYGDDVRHDEHLHARITTTEG